MQVADDMTLLREYAESRSESAFTALVERHINFVYSTALRQVRNPQLAQEVTQVVFIILARKAAKINPKSVLSGWLFRTVRFTASAQIKSSIRRQRREQEAHMESLTTQEASPEETWQKMSPLLDEALAKLSETDRQAVLLRYFESKSLSQVGGALAVNEDAARKRVSRALEKLRQFFVKRGIALSVVAIGGALSAQAVQAAPSGLAATISATALKGSAGAASTLTLLKGALKLMTLAKLKLAAATGAAVVAIAATALAVEKLVVETATVQQSEAGKDVPQATSTPTASVTQPENPRPQPEFAAAKTRAPRPAETSEIDDSAWSNMGMSSSQAFAKLPPAFILRPTHFGAQKSQMMASVGFVNGAQEAKMLARAISFDTLMGAAYAVPASRVIFPEGMPEEKVDVLINSPGATLQMLQDAIKTQYGLGTTREMRAGDVLVVKVKNPEAPGLKPSPSPSVATAGTRGGFGGGGGGSFGDGGGFDSITAKSSRVQSSSSAQATGSAGFRTAVRVGLNNYTAQGQTIDSLLRQLQQHFEVPLDDETGLTGAYDISLKWHPSGDGKSSDSIKTAMLEQLGLELTPDRAQVEMLVVKKVE